jgi:FAD/FMN-containing dehydrogenase
MRPQRNWGGNHAYRFARFHEPDTLDELISLVGEATRLRVIGSRHCFNDIGDTDPVAGDLVSLRQLPSHHEVDSERRVVRVSAAASYGEPAAGLHAEGWALPNLASLDARPALPRRVDDVQEVGDLGDEVVDVRVPLAVVRRGEQHLRVVVEEHEPHVVNAADLIGPDQVAAEQL